MSSFGERGRNGYPEPFDTCLAAIGIAIGTDILHLRGFDDAGSAGLRQKISLGLALLGVGIGAVLGAVLTHRP